MNTSLPAPERASHDTSDGENLQLHARLGSSLPGDAVIDFRRDGYYLARGLIDLESVAELRRAGHEVIERLATRHNVRGTWQSVDGGAVDDVSAGTTDLFHCHDVQYQAAIFNQMLSDRRITSAFAALMDSGDVQLHHNKLFIKPPGRGSPFPWHQDWPFFPHTDDSLIAAIIHLDDATEDKGCLKVVPGSHMRGRLDHEGDRDWHLAADAVDQSEVVSLPAAAGDVLFFSSLTIHGSGVNHSVEPRTTWLIQVRDPADTPTVERHRSRGQGVMLAGVNRADPPPPTVFS